MKTDAPLKFWEVDQSHYLCVCVCVYVCVYVHVLCSNTSTSGAAELCGCVTRDSVQSGRGGGLR